MDPQMKEKENSPHKTKEKKMVKEVDNYKEIIRSWNRERNKNVERKYEEAGEEKCSFKDQKFTKKKRC